MLRFVFGFGFAKATSAPAFPRLPLRRFARALGAVLLAACALPALADIPAVERNALIDLYNSTNGDGWTDNTGWKTAGSFSGVGTECTWYGVICDAMQTHITYIDPHDNHLAGTLPPTLNTLTALQHFNVSNNQLYGDIPPLTGLTALQYFSVFNNQLDGSIPDLTGLTALNYFDVSTNKLIGSIPSLAGLTALQAFFADSNQLTGSIPSLAGVPTLLTFWADNNRLTGNIPSLAGLTALNSFRVQNNQLTGSIPSLSGLTMLVIFRVENNQLTGTPPDAPFSLAAGNSQLCPNYLSAPSPTDAAWDTATGTADWHATCSAAPTVTLNASAAFSSPVAGATLPNLTLTCTPGATTVTPGSIWTVATGAACTLATTGGTTPAGYVVDSTSFDGPANIFTNPASGSFTAFTVPAGGTANLNVTVTLKAMPVATVATAVPTLETTALGLLATLLALTAAARRRQHG